MRAAKKGFAYYDMTRSEQVANRCQLCNKEKSVGKVATLEGTLRIGRACADKIAAIAKDAGVEFSFP